MEPTKSDHFPRILDHIQRASADNLKRAARHYNRTLAVLQQGGFEYMSTSTRQKLEGHLSDGLRVVEQELRRRESESHEAEGALTPSGRSETTAERRFVDDSVVNPA